MGEKWRGFINKPDVTRKVSLQKSLVLNMDSSVSETYVNQEDSAYNGHFGCTCYHSLFYFNQEGDLEAAILPEGNVHRAANWGYRKRRVIAKVE
jgi:hypothetical protein